MNRDNRAFTLLELAVVLVVLLVFAVLTLSLFSGTRRGPARMIENSSRIRGIHQSMVIYAQGNNGYFPGLTADGDVDDLSVEHRFQILLERDYLIPDYIISPGEKLTDWSPPAPGTPSTPITSANYSHAMLQVPDAGHRRDEWRDTSNSLAAVLSDRNTGPDANANVQSIWTATPGTWEGAVGFNDNHVTREVVPIVQTQYGESAEFPTDHLFQNGDPTDAQGNPANPDDDAFMVHSGN